MTYSPTGKFNGADLYMTDIVEILGTTVLARTAGLGQLSALAVVVGRLVPHNVRHCWRAIVME